MRKPVRRTIMTPNTESKINRMHRGKSWVTMAKEESEENKKEENEEKVKEKENEKENKKVEKCTKELSTKLAKIKEFKEKNVVVEKIPVKHEYK